MEPTPREVSHDQEDTRPEDANSPVAEHAPEKPEAAPSSKVPAEGGVAEHYPSLLPALGMVLAVLVLALLGLYYWSAPRAEAPGAPTVAPAEIPETPTEDPLAEQLSVQDSSDEISAIEKDLSQTELDAVDQELSAIEAELEGTLPQVK